MPAAVETHTAAHSLPVNATTLDHLSAIAGKLGAARSDLTDIAGRIGDDDLDTCLRDLAGIIAALQSAVTRARTQPVSNAWRALPHVVRELGVRLGKTIEVEILGGETELDQRVLDVIKEPLIHLARNAADHGLETPHERRALAKPETGVIRFSAASAEDHATILVSDDGRGLDSEKIRAHAIASGFAGRAEIEAMSDATLHDFVFAPGFSTAAEVTSVSGRGIGLDIARTNIARAGGSIEVSSVPGKGTTFIMKLPLGPCSEGEPPRLGGPTGNFGLPVEQLFRSKTGEWPSRDIGRQTRLV